MKTFSSLNAASRLLLVTASATAFSWAACAADWPQWGGSDPGRNMYSPETGLPDKFDPGKPKAGGDTIDIATTKNVRWAVKLGDQAFGNVVVSGGKIYIGTNNGSPRNPRTQGDNSVLMCFDEKTGAFLWQLVVPKLASGKVNDWEGLGLLSSPCVQGNRVYLVTSRCEVICLTTDGLRAGNVGPFVDEAQYIAGPGKPKVQTGPTDADIVWKYDMMDELGVFPHNASNCSVLIIGDVLYVCTSNGQDWTHVNIPSPNSPSFVALNKNTGELVGEDDAKIGPHIFHGQWSSPSTGVVNGKQLVFFGGGDGFCYAFDSKPVKQGESSFLKTIWKYDCNPYDHEFKDGHKMKYGPTSPDGPSEVNATPVFWKNRVYVAVGQDPEHGEGIGNFSCIDATGTGDITKTAKIWNFDKIHRSISTASITPDGLLFIADFSGFLYCLDAETGKLNWMHDLKAHVWGSTLVADGKVYVGDEDGDVYVFAATKEKKLLSTQNMGAAVYSTPVAANGVLYVASQTHLYAVYDSSKNPGLQDGKAKSPVDLPKP